MDGFNHTGDSSLWIGRQTYHYFIAGNQAAYGAAKITTNQLAIMGFNIGMLTETGNNRGLQLGAE